MKFSDVIGNTEVKEALVRMADSGRVPHAIMFHENEGCGALALAVAFVQYLNCKSHNGEILAAYARPATRFPNSSGRTFTLYSL